MSETNNDNNNDTCTVSKLLGGQIRRFCFHEKKTYLGGSHLAIWILIFNYYVFY